MIEQKTTEYTLFQSASVRLENAVRALGGQAKYVEKMLQLDRITFLGDAETCYQQIRMAALQGQFCHWCPDIDNTIKREASRHLGGEYMIGSDRYISGHNAAQAIGIQMIYTLGSVFSACVNGLWNPDQGPIYSLCRHFLKFYPSSRLMDAMDGKGVDEDRFLLSASSYLRHVSLPSSEDCERLAIRIDQERSFADDVLKDSRTFLFHDGMKESWCKLRDVIFELRDLRAIVHPGLNRPLLPTKYTEACIKVQKILASANRALECWDEPRILSFIPEWLELLIEASEKCDEATLTVPYGEWSSDFEQLVGWIHGYESVVISAVDRYFLGQPHDAQQESPRRNKSKYQTDKPPKKRPSTGSGEARVKIIARLTQHHGYDNGSCTSFAHIGVSQLARYVGVAKSTVSKFFSEEFGNHQQYKNHCADKHKLINSLKLLNNELKPKILNNNLGAADRDLSYE